MSTTNTFTVELEEQALNQGIKSSNRNISILFGLENTTLNANIGKYDGIGPRYGMQAVPYQDVNLADTRVAGFPIALRPESLVLSEADDLAYMENRTRIYAIYPVKVSQYSDATLLNSGVDDTGITYFFITAANTAPTPQLYSIAYTCSLYYVSTSQYIARHTKYFDKGVASDNITTGLRISDANTSRTLPNQPTALDNLNPWVKTAFAVISGVDTPVNNIAGTANAGGTTTTYPGSWVFGVYSKEVNFKTFDQKSAAYEVIVSGCGNSGGAAGTNNPELFRRFRYNSLAISNGSVSTSLISPDYALGLTITNATITQAASSVTPGTNLANLTTNFTYLFKNGNFKINSSYSAFLIASQDPVCGIFQEWIQSRGSSTTNKPTAIQYFDPTSLYLQVKDQNTASYTDNGTTKYTGFSAFPPFIPGTTIALDASTTRDGTAVQHYTLGAAGSGLLRQNTTYELGFSLYDKGTDTECNVCTPVKFYVGATDFVRLSVYRQQTTGTAPERTYAGTNPLSILGNANYYSVSSTPDLTTFFNHTEIRFYYRAVGSFEWLPTAKFDLAAFYYDPTPKTYWICENAIASLPGGQPGGFVDYSPLPKDKYIDVVFFQGYAFWMSLSNVIFSNRYDVFTYPVTNSIPVSKGYGKGMIEHVYPGQSVQDSRLLIFTSEAIYAARFDGDYDQVQVRVDPNTSATFPRPGSNLRLTFWTSNVAFSARSAVIANGVLYYWGPTGLYRDGGEEIPDRTFSYVIEPLIHELYDKTKTDNIHSVYNDKTKEVIWFYTPRQMTDTGGSKTKALAYNTKWGQFYLYDFGQTIVDSSQLVDIQLNRTANTDICGTRVLLYVRDGATANRPQRPVFFDELCDCGDLRPTTIKFCQSVSVQGANRRLTIVQESPNYVTLPTSGTLNIDNYNGYKDVAFDTANPDGLYTIAGGDGSTYIDIAPINGTWTDYDFYMFDQNQTPTCFPVQWEVVHGFTFKIVSQYWAARGMRSWSRWMYCYQSFKADLLKRSGTQQQIRMKFYTILGTGNSQRDLNIADNSKGNFQVHSQIIYNQQNAEGQALATEWTTPTGVFCGSQWFVQYLSFDMTDMPKNNFKTWEG